MVDKPCTKCLIATNERPFLLRHHVLTTECRRRNSLRILFVSHTFCHVILCLIADRWRSKLLPALHLSGGVRISVPVTRTSHAHVVSITAMVVCSCCLQKRQRLHITRRQRPYSAYSTATRLNCRGSHLYSFCPFLLHSPLRVDSAVVEEYNCLIAS
jgi:hypothetical protein